MEGSGTTNKAPGPQSLNETKMGISQQQFEFFKDNIASVTQEINQNRQKFNIADKSQILIDENGVRLSAPSERLGKHATVYFLDLEKEGKKFECVLRSSAGDAQKYQEVVKEFSVVKKYLPALYGTQNGWAVMERLHGIEFGIKEKIKEDGFRSRYAKKCAEAVYELGSSGLYLNDSVFTSGHNIIAQEDGSFKFIEHISLLPDKPKDLKFTSNEIIAEKVFSSLLLKKSDEQDESERHTKDEYKYDFDFQFLKNLLNKISPEDFSIKYRYLDSSNEYYRDEFNSKNRVKTEYNENLGLWDERDLTDEEYAAIPEEKKTPLPWLGNSRVYSNGKIGGSAGITFNPEFVKAIQNDDMEGFKKMIDQNQAVIPLEDTEKNRVLF